MVLSGEFSIGISVSQAYLHYISYSHVRQMVSVSTFLWKNKPSNKRIISLCKRKKRWSLFLIVSREYLTFTDTREGEKEYSRFQPTSKWLVSRRGRTQNVKPFPASHAQMIIWIFRESLPSPSPFSLLKVPSLEMTPRSTPAALNISRVGSALPRILN